MSSRKTCTKQRFRSSKHPEPCSVHHAVRGTVHQGAPCTTASRKPRIIYVGQCQKDMVAASDITKLVHERAELTPELKTEVLALVQSKPANRFRSAYKQFVARDDLTRSLVQGLMDTSSAMGHDVPQLNDAHSQYLRKLEERGSRSSVDPVSPWTLSFKCFQVLFF